MAVRPNSRSNAVSQGKGLDPDAARASALMESIEAWHAENLELPLRFESADVLRRSARVMELDKLPRAVGRVAPYDVPILWVEGRDLMRDEPVFVPHEMVTMNFVAPPEYRPLFARGSNGLSSGNHLLEAIVHGLCEVIERDAMALWFADEEDAITKSTQVDPSSVDDPVVARSWRASMQPMWGSASGT
jgi:ribosomal protein S12 methylthiotransferase accessory factor